MARPTRLDGAEIEKRLAGLEGWSLDGGKLFRSFRFADFNEAFGFMARAALVAETLNHHPEWLHVYARVDVRLETHDAGGITELDFALAERMNGLA